MRRLLLKGFLYFEISRIVNVVIFAVYSSKCAIYFEMCGSWTTLVRPRKLADLAETITMSHFVSKAPQPMPVLWCLEINVALIKVIMRNQYLPVTMTTFPVKSIGIAEEVDAMMLFSKRFLPVHRVLYLMFLPTGHSRG